MAHWKNIFLLSVTLACIFQAQGADKYTDENRPYEFGFSIDGEQHRHEKKDENGIIMGEFGFITADGVYHVTVYATDENGNFKIISMKNIRVKPYPTAAIAKDTRTGHALSIPPQSPDTITTAKPLQNAASYSQTTSLPQQTKKPINPILEPVRACSHCSIPTTTTVKPIYTEENVGGITPNNDKGFNSPGTSNNFNTNNNFQEISTIPKTSNTGINTNSNSGLIRPQNNKVYSSSSLNLSDGVNLIPNISQLPLDNNAQSYGPDSSGYNQQNPTGTPYQNNYQNSIGSSFSQPSQGGNPQQYNPIQSSVIDNNSRPELGNVPSAVNNEGNSFNENYPQNSVGNVPSSNAFNTEGNNFNKNYPGNNVGNLPSSNSFNTESNSFNKKYPGNNVGNLPSSNSFNTESNSFNKKYPGNNVGNLPSSNSFNAEGNSFNNPQNSVVNSGSIYAQDNVGDRNPKQLNSGINSEGISQSQAGTGQNKGLGITNAGIPNKPVLISAQMQIVDKNTDVNYKKPGEKDGLPDGLTKGDMENLLYTFNYTLAFHGHYEEGYTSGAKQGYYFVTGRNGVRTRIDYVADENGFRPKITQEVLDLISEDVPKPETEKDEKYGLRGYEFKWLYFPVDSKQR